MFSSNIRRGCSVFISIKIRVNLFIKNSVEFIINQSSDFDFGDDDEEEKEEVELERKIDETKPIVTEIITKTHEIPVIAHGKILDDYGNVVGTF